MILAACVALVACSDDKDEPITATSLPQQARNFISTYFSDSKMLKAEKDVDDGVVTYDVTFTDGFELEFDADGQWLKVDAPGYQTIPDGIAPQTIADYVSTNYPKAGINEISRVTYGYEVELNNNVELHFDSQGNFLATDK